MLRRIATGILLSGAVIAVTLVAQILSVPVYLKFWGPRVYGEWVTLTSLVTSISILNLGVQSYVNNILIACFVNRRFEEGTRVLTAALRLYFGLSMLALMGLSALCLFPELIRTFGITVIPSREVRVILALQGLLTTYGMVGGLLASVFRATQQVPRHLTYGLVQAILTLGVPCLVAFSGGRPVQASIATVAALTIVGAIQLRDIFRRSPFAISFVGSTWKESFALLGPSSLFFAVTVSTQILATGTVLLLSSIAGPLTVTLFTTTLMMSNFVRTLTNQGMYVFYPEIAAAAAGADVGRLVRWHRLLWKLGFSFGLVSAIAIFLFGNEVLSLWTAGRVTPDPVLNLLLAAYLVVHVPALISTMFGLAANRQTSVFMVQISTVALSLTLTVLLGQGFGAATASGTATALLLGQIGGTVLITWTACTWTGDKIVAVLRQSVLRVVPMVVLAALVIIACVSLISDSSVRLCAFAATIPIFLLVTWFTCFTAYERKVLVQRFQIGRFRAVVPA